MQKYAYINSCNMRERKQVLVMLIFMETEVRAIGPVIAHKF